jgi:hypothetical protein
MSVHFAEWSRLDDPDGYVILPSVFPPERVDEMIKNLTVAIEAELEDASAIRGREGVVYAARNVVDWWTGAQFICDQPPIPEALGAILGSGYGLVRTLYFDKPPERSWALPWHKLTIAVRDNRIPSRRFQRPTRKAGVPHVEAPVEILQAMLTARVHLDDVTEENGPVRVLPGSHRSGKCLHIDEAQPVSILAKRGDVLLIRPLVTHCSTNSRPDTSRHRRILHFEFAASAELPDGYQWHTFRSRSPNSLCHTAGLAV